MKPLYLLLICFCFFLCGCSTYQQDDEVDKNVAYSVVDARGKHIEFRCKPTRIISTYVYGDEILLDLVDHKRIAGLSQWVHDPGLSLGSERARDVKVIVENNIESLISLNPDLILLPSTTKLDYVESLEEVDQKVYLYQAASRAQHIPDMIKSIGAAVGEQKQANKIIENMQERLARVEKKVARIPQSKRENALLFLRFGAIGGKGSIFNDTMTMAGIEDCYHRARSEEDTKPGVSRILSKEEAVKANPSTIILSSWSQAGAYHNSEQLIAEMYNDPAYADVEAIKNKNVIVIPQGYVNCLSQNIALGVEKLYEAVYERAE